MDGTTKKYASEKAILEASQPTCWFIWGFPSMRVPQNEWFMMEHHIKMHDLTVPQF